MLFFRAIVLSVFLTAFFAAACLAGPTTVFAPDNVTITPPDSKLPQEIKAFFGTNGKWWGTWYGTPPGHMEAILIFKRMDSKTADVLYILPNYPTWGIKAVTIELAAKFEKRDGKMHLVIPPSKNGQQMAFAFDSSAFLGTIQGPFLTANIVWESLE